MAGENVCIKLVYANFNTVVGATLERKKKAKVVPVDIFTNEKSVHFAQPIFQAGDSNNKEDT